MKPPQVCLFFLLLVSKLANASVHIVAAENVYGNVAEQIGGSSVRVISVLNHPNQDPHEFQSDAATAKLIANADVIIYNGLGYDEWMEKFLKVTGKPHRAVIRVADLIKANSGDNPHIWYDPNTISVLATQISQLLDRPQAAVSFHRSMKPLYNKITVLKSKAAGIKVTATEPIFGHMASVLGFIMLNYDYQLAMMNGTEPSFAQIANFEKSLNDHTAKMLFYNSQVVSPSTKRMLALAQKNHIPVIGITETQPLTEKNYVDWMLSELSSVETELNTLETLTNQD